MLNAQNDPTVMKNALNLYCIFNTVIKNQEFKWGSHKNLKRNISLFFTFDTFVILKGVKHVGVWRAGDVKSGKNGKVAKKRAKHFKFLSYSKYGINREANG